ncbi:MULTISPECIES: GPR endopeptidase [Anaerostipes]|uniref:GPR endopeptidase n=1 Tax=Anaerostipes TaxID=207244 RepID=UPI00095190CD|nr:MULTISPECIES: GPR endopeptidase [Anaerostipes]MCI5623713.1 GPR endopeptidase [Anaerostipes sp.]MDY2726663.1 GPR endopeptidase [Anaerostipes faecalis]OLR58653.1 endopeptidase [Anaerostipes sp. 494a]
MQNRTDLALELKEDMTEESLLSGVAVKTRIDTANHMKETKIIIKNKKGEEALGKPIGQYITIEAKNLSRNDGDFHREMSKALCDNLKEMIPRNAKVLVAGLGNAGVTADSLGPKVVEQLYVTRHLKKEGLLNSAMELSAIAPGVMAQTGIETSEILEALVDKTKPDYVIAIDALAARSSYRLNRTIQISDTGIAPGSGVGNHRNEITRRTVGIPVLAVGVPTVISVPAIINDLLEEENQEKAYQRLDEEFISMHVTPKNIDESMRRISYTISEGINQLLHIHGNYE